MSAESSQTSLRKVVSDGRSDPELLHMVRRHYDNEQLMRLQGEIHFAALSRAEVEVARRVYGRPLPLSGYLPCCGTLRHTQPLLERGVGHLVAVDLSLASLTAGLQRNVPEALRDKVSVYHGDVCFVGGPVLGDGVTFAFLGGNSLGDITDVGGPAEFVRSLAAALAPGGVLVFDYVGDRYAPRAADGPPSGRRSTEATPVTSRSSTGGPGGSARSPGPRCRFCTAPPRCGTPGPANPSSRPTPTTS